MSAESQFIAQELERLDLLIHRQILRLRTAYQLSLDEFRGLYVSDQHVDDLINRPHESTPGSSVKTYELTEKARELRRTGRPLPEPWRRLIRKFALTEFEVDVLVLAVAPEFDLKYETIYSYLNNDITRKWPTRDLALRMFGAGSEFSPEERSVLTSRAPLFAKGLLRPQDDSAPLSWLAMGFRSHPGLSGFLLGQGFQNTDLIGVSRIRDTAEDWAIAPKAKAEIDSMAALYRGTEKDVPVVFCVVRGRDSEAPVHAARRLCRVLEVPLLVVDLRSIEAKVLEKEDWVRSLRLQRALTGAGVLVEHCEELFDGNRKPIAAASRLLDGLDEQGPVVVSASSPVPWPALLAGRRWLDLALDHPDEGERRRLWLECTDRQGIVLDQEAARVLADRYVCGPSDIKDAVRGARDKLALGNGSGPKLEHELSAQIRRRSTQDLARLASSVPGRRTWDDLVLPRTPTRQLRELASAIRNRIRVYREWGFESRAAMGRGFKVLFTGPSGTGKTLAASVLAGGLDLDLFSIDLSSVVSKYIGETEKNLDKVFRAAEQSNAILFFDEADALFGKRSEVKDAHDRYANIEVAYLLQKMEIYDGAAILATNLKRNIDDAFLRRMHTVIEFPRPNADQRRGIWKRMLPPPAPLGEDIDFDFLAQTFDLTGGEIHNASLEAAFIAADEEHAIDLTTLVRAVRRQLAKKGAMPSLAQFGRFGKLIEETG